VTDLDYMTLALHLAEQGRGRTSPNPKVGALIVAADATVVGAGYHARAGEAHAEVRALEAAGRAATGATLYSTLEPCCHVGRTGPCVERIHAAGIRRVVAAMQDPNPVVSGRGFQYLRAHGIEVTVGPGRSAAARMNREFLTFVSKRRPFVIAKIASSVDGCIAAAPGERTRLTGTAANRRVQALRAEVDAIGVGSGTVLADDPLLTAREVYRDRPLTRVVFDRRLRTPPSSRLFSTLEAGPVIIMTAASSAAGQPERAAALARAGARLEVVGGPLAAAVARLAAWEITSLVIEGGATLMSAAWEADIIDYLQLYVTPAVLGSQGVRLFHEGGLSTTALFEARAEVHGADVLIEGYVHRPD